MGLFDVFKKKKEKITLDDDTFGILELVDEEWGNLYEIKLFDKTYTDVELIVETNDDNKILDEQKKSYKQYIENKEKLKLEIESMIIEKYNYMNKNELENSKPLKIKFNITGTVTLVCSIDKDGDEIVELEIIPEVKFIKVL